MEKKLLKLEDLEVDKRYILFDKETSYVYKIDDNKILYRRSFGKWEISNLPYNSIIRHGFEMVVEAVEYVSFQRALRHMQNGCYARLYDSEYAVSYNVFWKICKSEEEDEIVSLDYSKVISKMWVLLQKP